MLNWLNDFGMATWEMLLRLLFEHIPAVFNPVWQIVLRWKGVIFLLFALSCLAMCGSIALR